MVTKSRQKKLRSLITEAIRVLCKNGLDSDYQEEFTIEGLLGITLDNESVFLVNINETIRNDEDDEEEESPKQVPRRSLRAPTQPVTPNMSPKISQPPRLTPQSQRMVQQQQQQRAVAMKRKLETASPTPQQPAKRQQQQQQQAVPARTTRSSAAAVHKDEYEPETKQPTTEPAQETEYDAREQEAMQPEQEIEHISATDAAATTQEIQLIDSLEDRIHHRPKVIPLPPPTRDANNPPIVIHGHHGALTGVIPSAVQPGQSPQPIIIVPQPKPRHTTMRSNGHRGLQPLHVSIPAPIQAVHIEQLFSDLEEDMLVDHMRHFFEIGWGLINTTTPISLIGSNFANYLKKTGSTTPHVPLYPKWYRDLKLHKPDINKYEIRQKVSAAAKDETDDIGQIVSTDQISLYYERLTEKMKELDLSKRPYDIWMMEETQCEIFTNTNEKEIVTVVGSASCTGDVKPPMLTFKGKKQVTAGWTDGAGSGTKAFVSTSGVSSSAIIQKILACYFREYSSVSMSGYPEHPVLVLYDPRKGNVCPGVIEWAESKNIVLFPFPPHFESLLEPLEPGCVTPFKSAYEAELAELSAENANFIAHKHNVCAIVCKVYGEHVTSKAVVDAFIKLGIQVSKTKPRPK